MAEVKKFATRAAYGEVLQELGEEYPDLIVMEADLGQSTYSVKFRDKFPERYFDVGIAEQNLIGIASGVSKTGRTVLASTLAIFAPGRCWDQVRNTLAHSHCNVKVVTTHAGISIGKDGSSHQSLEDIALWRAIPGMRVIVPCDANETKKAVRKAVEIDGPFAIRLARPETPLVTPEEGEFELGKGMVLREGRDITLAACGLMVHECLEAAEVLDKEGISAEVLNLATVKPIDRDLLISSAGKTTRILPCEEHSIIGGFGSAVLEALEEERGVYAKRIGTADCWGESGEPDQLFEKYGLSAGHIVKTARQAMTK
jgi:transketolase